MEVDQVSK